LGGVLQVAAQIPALRRIGYTGKPVLDLKDPQVREMLRRIVPMTLGLGIYYVDMTLSRRFLSELGEGAQSYFFWASRLCDFPQGIFVMALSTAALPSLSTFAAKGQWDELGKTYAHGLRLALFVALPASAMFVVLAEPVVVTLFQRGEFDAVAAHQTARALVWQGGAIWTVAVVRQLVPVFHSMGDTRTPVIVSALDLAAFIGLALWLRHPMGHAGISVAVAGSSAVQMVLLFVGLRLRLKSLYANEILPSVLRTIASSAAGSLAGWIVARAVLGAGVHRALPGILGGAAFLVAFLVAAFVFRSPELHGILGGLRRKLGRARESTATP
ncbi:MAG: putative peptidoglycan lipid flippase MurJ, partial [Myxococcaceae bacterium]|nr:putative peptidoglycan lipid flippase MurJ [Myxococcaceae bacterium]